MHQFLTGVEIHFVDFLLAVVFSQNLNVVALAEYGEIPGCAYSIQNREILFIESVEPRFCYLPHDRHTQVKIFNRDDRVLRKIAADKLAPYVFRHFLAVHPCDMKFAKHREIDIAVTVDGVCGYIAGI